MPHYLNPSLVAEQVEASLHVYSRATDLYGDPTERHIRDLFGNASINLILPWKSSNGHQNFYVVFRTSEIANEIFAKRAKWAHNWGVEPINAKKIARLNRMLKELGRDRTWQKIKIEPEEEHRSPAKPEAQLGRKLSLIERTSMHDSILGQSDIQSSESTASNIGTVVALSPGPSTPLMAPRQASNGISPGRKRRLSQRSADDFENGNPSRKQRFSPPAPVPVPVPAPPTRPLLDRVREELDTSRRQRDEEAQSFRETIANLERHNADLEIQLRGRDALVASVDKQLEEHINTSEKLSRELEVERAQRTALEADKQLLLSAQKVPHALLEAYGVLRSAGLAAIKRHTATQAAPS